jgi:uncharacterized protein YggL (DUF469 family)
MKMLIELDGQEVLHYVSQIVVEVPDGMSEEQVEDVISEHISDVTESSDWELDDSEGIAFECISSVRQVEADHAADFKVIMDDSGFLVPARSA